MCVVAEGCWTPMLSLCLHPQRCQEIGGFVESFLLHIVSFGQGTCCPISPSLTDGPAFCQRWLWPSSTPEKPCHISGPISNGILLYTSQYKPETRHTIYLKNVFPAPLKNSAFVVLLSKFSFWMLLLMSSPQIYRLSDRIMLSAMPSTRAQTVY